MAFSIVLDFIFPRCCYGCGEVGGYLCFMCETRKFLKVVVPKCHVCKKKVLIGTFLHEKCYERTSLDGVVVALKYDKFIERLITDFKYEFISDLKSLLGNFLVESLKFSSIFSKNLVITYVPLHPKREKWRGYNQAKLLANYVGKNLKLPVIDLILRNKDTNTQVGLNREGRLINLKGAMGSAGVNKYKEVVIVDDVMTTGATLEECAKVLKANGVEKVYGLVIARG